MSLILNIDTATETATVSLAADGKVLQCISNANQKDHAAFIQPAIQQLLEHNQIAINSLDAIAVVNGPGSYTGLRVGMASAKGLCYALGKPLISIGTLELMAASAVEQVAPKTGQWFCPMIDARRMEVFTAVYDDLGNVIVEPCAMILDEQSFADLLADHRLIFFGNGADKYMTIQQHANAVFKKIVVDVAVLSRLTWELNQQQKFTSLAYSEPFYIKAFYSAQKGQQF